MEPSPISDPTSGLSTAPEQPQDTQDKPAPSVLARVGEAELSEWVDRLYVESERAKSEQAKTQKWDEWLNSYWGEIWDKELPTFKPPIVVNELQSLLLQEISDLTDSPPRIFVQSDATVKQREKEREKAIQAYWKREFVDLQVMLATLDAVIYPLGFVGVTYDPTADFGRGKLITKARSPMSVFPDPDCVDDDDWRYVILRDVMDLVAIRAIWPDHGWRVRPNDKWSIRDSNNNSQASTRGLGSQYSGPLYSGASAAGSRIDGYIKARASVLSCFILDNSVEEEIVERVNEQAQTTLVTVRKKKYPHGRLIQVAGDVVLYDGPNPYIRRFPLVRIGLQPSVHTFWPPVSILANVLELYKSANKLDSLVVENGIRLNAGMLVADTNSGLDPATFASIPGQLILKNPQSGLDVKYPPPMPPDMIQGGERLRNYARNVLGFPPSRIGSGNRGNVSPELTETEISQAMGLTRLRGRLLHNSVQKLVELIFSGMARFYQDSRIFPNSRGDRWDPIQWSPVSSNPEKYVVHVDPASFQVRSRTMLQRLYFMLAKMGKMPNDELLDALEIPNAEEVGEKLNKQLQMEALQGLQDQRRRARKR